MSEEKPKSLEERLRTAELNLGIAQTDNRVLRKRNYTMKWVTLGALALAALFYSCPRTVVQKEAVPYYLGQMEPRTYRLDVNEDGKDDEIHVSEFRPSIELQNPDGTYRKIKQQLTN